MEGQRLKGCPGQPSPLNCVDFRLGKLLSDDDQDYILDFRVAGLWIVVLLMMIPSIPEPVTASATSCISCFVKSGATLTTILALGHFHSELARSGRAFLALMTSESNSSKAPRPCNPLSPGVFGLDTFTTKTSTSGPNVATPVMKSFVLSGADVLFLPRLRARIDCLEEDGGYAERYDRKRERTTA